MYAHCLMEFGAMGLQFHNIYIVKVIPNSAALLPISALSFEEYLPYLPLLSCFAAPSIYFKTTLFAKAIVLLGMLLDTSPFSCGKQSFVEGLFSALIFLTYFHMAANSFRISEINFQKKQKILEISEN